MPTKSTSTEFANTLAAAAKCDKNQWELGDALIEDIGPPPEVGIRDGSQTRLGDVAIFLTENGYEHTGEYLSRMREVAHKFPDRRRRRSVCGFEVHRIAQSPEMLDLIIRSARLREGERLTLARAKSILEAIKDRENEERQKAYEEERAAAKAEGRKPKAPPEKSRKTPPPTNTEPVAKSRIEEIEAIHKLMGLIARAQAAEQDARKILEGRLGSLNRDDRDAIVEQGQSAANQWQQFVSIAKKKIPDANARSHLHAVS